MDQIIVDAEKRLRPVSEVGVESLIASINELGVIKDPIHVRRKGRGNDTLLVLIAGGHRLAAAKRLGWDDIPARVWADVTDDFATLMEIDDNLSGAELSVLELSVFLAKRKRVYERLHPEVKHGAQGGRGGNQNEADIMSFSKSVAEKRELSDRHIRRFIQIGEALSEREVATLGAAKAPLKLKDLLELAKINEPIVRADVVGKLAEGSVKSAAEAMAMLKPAASTAPKDPADDAFNALLKAWTRTPMAAKRRFVDELRDDLTSLFADHPDLEGA
nr:ParB N-terminal domain-containing protein [Aliiroseovarius lamellibrachiae]